MAPNHRPKVLVLAYVCSPYQGSEPGLAWNFVSRMAGYVDLDVISLDCDCRDEVQDYVQRFGLIPGLRFHWVEPSRWQRLLFSCPGLFYEAYRRWHRRALRTAKRLQHRVGFDLVHQLNMTGYREPGYLWKLGPPFIWGPVGGTQNFPWHLIPEAGVRGAPREIIRNLANFFQLRFSPRVRSAANAAAVLFTANSTNKGDFETVHGIAPRLVLETGVSRMTSRPKTGIGDRPIRLLWSGSLEAWKGLPVLLKALHQLPAGFAYQLRILGGGSLRTSYQGMARALAIDDRITWLGRLPHKEALRQNVWADTLIFTGLRDTSGNVVLEALAAGVPVISLDHHGVGDIVTSKCGIKIAVTTRRSIIRRIAAAIHLLVDDPGLYCRLSRGALARAHEYQWDRQVAKIVTAYEEVLKRPLSAR